MAVSSELEIAKKKKKKKKKNVKMAIISQLLVSLKNYVSISSSFV